MRLSPLVIVIIALVGVQAVIVSVAEVLNARAGFVLPRHDSEGGKWRTLAFSPDSDLKSWVGEEGLLAYPIGLLSVFLSAALSFDADRARRRFASAALVVSVGLFALVLYRGYWSSLGAFS